MRDEVNQMLDDGCRYHKIIAWLNNNGHPGIKPNTSPAGATALNQLKPGLTDDGRVQIEYHYKIRTYELTPHTRG